MTQDITPKILWGVCGIGHGHIFRQLPLIDHFAQSARIVIFGYGESYSTLGKHFEHYPNVSVLRVAVPFYVGNQDGLDFAATVRRPENNQDFTSINAAAMDAASKQIGRPDLVISDYEPISAQYAYAHDAPLVTIDQQSKYLCGDFPAPLNGQNFIDEVMRLRLFFPKAQSRLACSFFRVAKRASKQGHTTEDVTIFPSVLSDSITQLRRAPDADGKTILVYVSSQRPFGQSFEDIAAICAAMPDVQFHLFGKNIPPQLSQTAPNLTAYTHGDQRFYDVLARCNGIVSTAGHGLLSEAMHLGIPVYAAPLPLYEQEMNAHVIAANGFGVSHPCFDGDTLAAFIRDIPRHAAAIAADRTILLREAGQEGIIKHLQRWIKPPTP